MNGYYSLGGVSNSGDEEEFYVEIGPADIPADLYAQWFLPSYGTVMSDNKHYRQWGQNNKIVPRRLIVKRRKK